MAGKSTAFALIGDRYHNADYIRTALGKTLVRELGLTIDFTDEVTLLNADDLHGYQLLILFRDAMQWPNGYGATPAAEIISVPPVPELEQVVVEVLLTNYRQEMLKVQLYNLMPVFDVLDDLIASLGLEDCQGARTYLSPIYRGW